MAVPPVSSDLSRAHQGRNTTGQGRRTSTTKLYELRDNLKSNQDRKPTKPVSVDPSPAHRAYREQQGLSQEAFADELGVHRTYMGGIEPGERNLTLRSLERIAELINADPLALLEP